MKINFLSLILISCLFSVLTNLNGQDYREVSLKERYLRIMFYNVENLFDFENDSLTNDEEFLPEGSRFWTKFRYYEKLQHISSVIVALGGWNPPELIGMCEIENRRVLDDLCKYSSLAKLKYRIIHKESPDGRGIDVALIYQPNAFKPLGYKAIAVDFPDNPGFKTRDILYVHGLARNSDTLHVFVNHWPSRYGGQLESEQSRKRAAEIVRNAVDSVFMLHPKAKIVIMGDLNDYPDNMSLTKSLKALSDFEQVKDLELYNLSAYLQKTSKIGSHKFEGEWGVLDQIIVSGNLLNSTHGLATKKEKAGIFNADFLLEDDEMYTGKKTFRTYIGFKYHGGYSDHLPVYLDLDNILFTE